MKVNTYSVKGIKAGTTNLPEQFTSKVNMPLLVQAIRVYENHQHNYLAKTKTRSNVSLTTKKLYRQKGTGGARHGDKAAPIFVGGGTAHGPTGLQHALVLPEKMKKKALSTAIALQAQKGKVLVVEGFSTIKKTKDAASLLKKLRKDEKMSAKGQVTIVLADKNKDKALFLRNIPNILVMPMQNLNPYTVFFSTGIVIDNENFEKKAEKPAAKKSTVKRATRVNAKKVEVKKS